MRTIDLRHKSEPQRTAEPRPFVRPQSKIEATPIRAVASPRSTPPQTQPTQTPADSHRITWRIPEEVPVNKKSLYIFMVLLVAAGVFSYIKGNTLFAIFLLMGPILLVLREYSVRPTIAGIDSKGVSLGNHFYNFSSIKSFWVEYEPNGYKELIMDLNHWYLPQVKILFNQENPLTIRRLMLRSVPEIQSPPSLVDALIKRVGL